MTEDSMENPALTTEQQTFLEDLARTADEKLLTAGQDSANKAFNLGCSVGLLPAAVFIGLTLLITRGSWIATGFITGLMAIGLLAFANLSASVSRSRTLQRVYQQEILPEIEIELGQIGLDLVTFKAVALVTISPDGPLQAFIERE